MATQAIERHFSKSEVALLTTGLPLLNQWSDALLVTFHGRRLRGARVAWINRRWFLERGFDLADSAVGQRMSDWLVDEFAFCVPGSNDSASSFTEESRTLYADRYGGTSGLSPHGGSGRVATFGCFQAKGVGQTPLVGEGAPAGHSHGCLSLAECLREAIYAEVATAEFPHGAIPIIAVLDTGLTFSSPNPDDKYDQHVRRGIAIRPACVRAAHAERAPLFKRSLSGFMNSQQDDVRRTRHVIQRWAIEVGAERNLGGEAALTMFVRAVMRQIAFGQVHRLFSGGYFSQNVTHRGELLDFGNMHALPDWARAQVHSVVAGFGCEPLLIRRVILTLAFYFTKYLKKRGDSTALAQHLSVEAEQTLNLAWHRYALALFGCDEESKAAAGLSRILQTYYRSQQRRCVKYRFGIKTGDSLFAPPGWIYDAIVDETYQSETEEYQTCLAIDQLLRLSMTAEQRSIAWQTAARLLQPRPSIYRERLLVQLTGLTALDRREIDVSQIDAWVRDSIDGARRHWPRLPRGVAVLAHVSNAGSSALLCAAGNAPPWLWLEGIRDNENILHLFHHRIETTELSLQHNGAYCAMKIPAVVDNDGRWNGVLPDQNLCLPMMRTHYPRPASRWLMP